MENRKVVILYKSCLIRFGYELSETLCNMVQNIEIIDITENDEDLIQIVTICRYLLQGNRANKAKKMIKELMEDDTS